jgi:prephenate dehydrogenase
MSMTRDVGVIGLGRMGAGIARRLDEAGRLGGAWDANGDAGARAGLSGAVGLVPPREIARTCATVLFSPPRVPRRPGGWRSSPPATGAPISMRA